MSDPLKTYPPPGENPECRCCPNLAAAFFCQTGHMLECHYPLTCDEARCSHLAKYDGYSPDEDAEVAR